MQTFAFTANVCNYACCSIKKDTYSKALIYLIFFFNEKIKFNAVILLIFVMKE